MIAKRLLLVSAFLASAHSQFSYNNPRPDISFDDRNDRFDVSSMMNEHRLFREHEEDFRRKDSDNLMKLLTALSRRRSEDGAFAYHDTMDDDGSSKSDFEANLKQFQRARPDARKAMKYVEYLHGGKVRRMGGSDAEKEIFMHYAVPINLKVQGYLKPPLDD